MQLENRVCYLIIDQGRAAQDQACLDTQSFGIGLGCSLLAGGSEDQRSAHAVGQRAAAEAIREVLGIGQNRGGRCFKELLGHITEVS